MTVVSRRVWAAVAGVLAAVLSLAALSAATSSRPRAPRPVAAAPSPDGELSGVPRELGSGPSAPAPPPPSQPTAPGATVPARAGEVLPRLGRGAPQPRPDRLARVLAPLLGVSSLGSNVSAVVVDAATGARLAGRDPTVPRSPASTAKVLTAAAALSTLGPQHTMATRVVTGRSDGEVVLVGGGDVLLGAGRGRTGRVSGHAGLDDLAAGTARALRAAGRDAVRLRLDDSLFSGPATSAEWESTDVADGFVAPVMSLEIDRGRSSRGTAVRDPALAAARTFAGLLRRRGIDAGSPRRGTAPRGADVLAEVRSASVGDLVEFTLTESDNTVAEALARLVAADAGRPATFVDAGAAVLGRVEDLDLVTGDARLLGGSGLAAGSRIPVDLLTRVLVLAASADHPALRPLLTGLPVGGASGTLANRFDGPDRAGAGVVRAKTGTLRGVSSLAGTVVDADGRQLAFAVLADRVPDTGRARTALDRIATALAGCGCR